MDWTKVLALHFSFFNNLLLSDVCHTLLLFQCDIAKMLILASFTQKNLWFTSFCGTHKEKFSRMFMLLFSILWNWTLTMVCEVPKWKKRHNKICHVMYFKVFFTFRFDIFMQNRQIYSWLSSRLLHFTLKSHMHISKYVTSKCVVLDLASVMPI